MSFSSKLRRDRNDFFAHFGRIFESSSMAEVISKKFTWLCCMRSRKIKRMKKWEEKANVQIWLLLGKMNAWQRLVLFEAGIARNLPPRYQSIHFRYEVISRHTKNVFNLMGWLHKSRQLKKNPKTKIENLLNRYWRNLITISSLN